MLQVQGWGEDEYEFVNIGAYSSKINAETAQRNAISEWAEDTGGELITKIEVWDVDA
jgi:hypothetical protein